MKKIFIKRVITFSLAFTLLFLAFANNGEKFVRDTGNMICLDCIGLGKRQMRMRIRGNND